MQVQVKINNHFLEFTHDYEHDQYILIGGYGSGKSYTTARFNPYSNGSSFFMI